MNPQFPDLDETMRQLELRLSGLSSQDIRYDCMFCGRERTVADDNHAPDCAYWFVFPNGNT